MKVLIDGYNLIFQCGLQGKSASSAALENARFRLVSELKASLDEETRIQTTIVFDAKDRPVKFATDQEVVDGIRVLFAVNHDSADSMIEELIRKHSSPKQLTVVSSDHRIQQAAKRKKAKAVDSDIWFDQLDAFSIAPKRENSSDEKMGLNDSNPFPPGYGEDI